MGVDCGTVYWFSDSNIFQPRCRDGCPYKLFAGLSIGVFISHPLLLPAPHYLFSLFVPLVPIGPSW